VSATAGRAEAAAADVTDVRAAAAPAGTVSVQPASSSAWRSAVVRATSDSPSAERGERLGGRGSVVVEVLAACTARVECAVACTAVVVVVVVGGRGPEVLRAGAGVLTGWVFMLFILP
jgi:hypothetical protein